MFLAQLLEGKGLVKQSGADPVEELLRLQFELKVILSICQRLLEKIRMST